jgi:hypothetical protein
MPDSLSHLADEALDQLVHQFARPMDFIRELVQNSIDAGTPRIEIWVDWSAPAGSEAQGMLEIHVDDFGEGMDEAIIDSQLTRMFSSTKEDDLTKIGKFGIGFTSVFAIGPSAVLLHTGRHGESWEVLFHPDRSFDKTALDQPVRGTQITLFKALDPGLVHGTITELREVLEYWCEHSDVPILFSDRRGASTAEAAGQAEAQDAWAGFAQGADAAAPAESIARPMVLDTPVKIRVKIDGVEAEIGYLPTPSYSFFNGGITLIRSTDLATLGPAEAALGHLSFKVKYRMLEHTLTRDNVLHDAAWAKTIEIIKTAAADLPALLLGHLQQLTTDNPAVLDDWQLHLARELAVCPDFPLEMLEESTVLVDRHLQPIRTCDVLAQARRWDAFLLCPSDEQMALRLEAQGLHLLPHTPATARLLTAFSETRFELLDALRARCRVAQADAVLVVPEPVPEGERTEAESVLIRAASFFIGKATRLRAEVFLVQMGQTLSDAQIPFACLGCPETPLSPRRHAPSRLERLRVQRVQILVNRDHPLWRDLRTVAQTHPVAARMALSQAIAEDCSLGDEVDLAALNVNPLEVLL